MIRIRLRRRGTHTEHLFATFRRFLWEVLFPIRRHIMAVIALMLVVSSVVLVLNQRLPFPSPGESILLDPTDWSLLFHRDPPLPARPDMRSPGPSIGGSTFVQPPLAILLYRAHAGDTMSGIATKLGMDIDTISSMNRVEGRGVHNVTVGETLRIPSQNGITLTLAPDFDGQCRTYGVSPEDVLAANALEKIVIPGMDNVGKPDEQYFHIAVKSLAKRL